MKAKDIKFACIGEFSEGCAPAVAEDGKIYMLKEDGSAVATKYTNVNGAKYPHTVEIAPFKNGVCALLFNDSSVNPYMSSAENYSSVTYLTAGGYELAHKLDEDLTFDPNDPQKKKLISKYKKNPVKVDLTNVEIAGDVFEDPTNYKKYMKAEHIKDPETIKAMFSVVKHSFENQIRILEKKKEAGELTEIDYDLHFREISAFMEDATKDLLKLLKKNKGTTDFGMGE